MRFWERCPPAGEEYGEVVEYFNSKYITVLKFTSTCRNNFGQRNKRSDMNLGFSASDFTEIMIINTH